jgi:hypothetical protein
VADPRPSARMGRRVLDPPEEFGPRPLFVWCRRDALVPIRFRRHVEKAPPSAGQLEPNYGHVPQLESLRETHAAVLRALSALEGSEVAAAAEVPAAKAAAEVPAAEVPEVAAARVLDSPVRGIGITEAAEGTAEHRADE